MPNWTALHSNIRDIGSALGTQARDKQQRKQEMADAIAMMEAKSRIANEYSEPTKWQPGSYEEAIKYEREKAGLNPKAAYQEDLRGLAQGQATPEDLTLKYPWKAEEIESLRFNLSPKIKRDPGFKMGTGGLISQVGSFFNPQQAELSKNDLELIEQIKTEADFEELMERAEEAEASGYNIKAILEYFGKQNQ